MTVSPLVSSVRNYLTHNYMHADEGWVSGCVEYLTSDESNNFSEEEIQNLAREQWLLNDLKDICPGSLPRNLKNQQKTMLNGRFALQINGVIDIGTPAYQQHLKLQKVNIENIEATTNFEEKIPSHRMIKLYLTDGVQDISGIEYKPMRNLSYDITPGCKILIKGPVDCRRGILLLKENNIELLGGEVQEIATSNSLAAILAAKLGVAISEVPNVNTTAHSNTHIPTPHTQMPTSYNQPERAAHIEPERTAQIHSEHSSTNRNDSEITAQIHSEHSRSNCSDPERTMPEHSRSIHSDPEIVPISINDDDIDIDQIADIEAQLYQPSKRPSRNEISKPDKKMKMDIVPNTIDDYPQDGDLFEDEDYLREMEANFDIQESRVRQVSSEPFVYIKQINEMNYRDKAGRVFRVKGQIIKLLCKLSVSKEEWILKCTIVDGTGSMDVDFTSTVLSKLVGFTPQEMNQMKKETASKPEIKEKCIAALAKAKDTLQALYCIIELTMSELPKITDLIPFDGSHLDMLRKRQTSW